MSATRIGLAGWSEAASRHRAMLPAAPEGATSLQRYARAFDFVEINASFYRQIRPATYEKWADEVPENFRFSVKMHRLITHYTRLKNVALLKDFFGSVSGLGHKLAAILVQLPPSLAFDGTIACEFFDALRRLYEGPVACEPRHASWESDEARALLAHHRVGPVLTKIPSAKQPAFSAGVPVYVRLHGTPRKYYSAYSSDDLVRLADFLRAQTRRARFAVFDNTATSAGMRNALELQTLLAPQRGI